MCGNAAGSSSRQNTCRTSAIAVGRGGPPHNSALLSTCNLKIYFQNVKVGLERTYQEVCRYVGGCRHKRIAAAVSTFNRQLCPAAVERTAYHTKVAPGTTLTYRSAFHHINDHNAVKPCDCLGGCGPHCQGTTHTVPHQQRGHTLRAAAKHMLPDCHYVLSHGLQQVPGSSSNSRYQSCHV
jgi:hypothetical protein